jgi:hypothetical protein
VGFANPFYPQNYPQKKEVINYTPLPHSTPFTIAELFNLLFN